ncbi:hypothetical protein F4679DRAFT_140886 [Xylaria curta]|nr:hypothetical protein F4679DRAFT_140886 [Xylaria curta]
MYHCLLQQLYPAFTANSVNDRHDRQDSETLLLGVSSRLIRIGQLTSTQLECDFGREIAISCTSSILRPGAGSHLPNGLFSQRAVTRLQRLQNTARTPAATNTYLHKYVFLSPNRAEDLNGPLRCRRRSRPVFRRCCRYCRSNVPPRIQRSLTARVILSRVDVWGRPNDIVISRFILRQDLNVTFYWAPNYGHDCAGGCYYGIVASSLADSRNLQSR